ncbi:hypothetical protein G9A89_019897 [Geosiphon pyriformis]|nr:hypothetical protein G9A89_019897 [Geosiphon pyriformis]
MNPVANHFVDIWFVVDFEEASKFCTMIDNGAGCDAILGHLSSHMIKSILKWPFHKVVLNHLVVNNDLVLEPSEVKSAVDTIMEGWTKKHTISDVLPIYWAAQYAPLSYVDDNAFSKVMCNIGSDEFLQVVKCLPDNKAVGLSGIPNKLWKHGNVQVLGGLLDILNVCLVLGVMPVY